MSDYSFLKRNTKRTIQNKNYMRVICGNTITYVYKQYHYWCNCGDSRIRPTFRKINVTKHGTCVHCGYYAVASYTNPRENGLRKRKVR